MCIIIGVLAKMYASALFWNQLFYSQEVPFLQDPNLGIIPKYDMPVMMDMIMIAFKGISGKNLGVLDLIIWPVTLIKEISSFTSTKKALRKNSMKDGVNRAREELKEVIGIGF